MDLIVDLRGVKSSIFCRVQTAAIIGVQPTNRSDATGTVTSRIAMDTRVRTNRTPVPIGDGAIGIKAVNAHYGRSQACGNVSKTERESDQVLGGSYAGGRFGIIRPGLPQDLSKFW